MSCHPRRWLFLLVHDGFDLLQGAPLRLDDELGGEDHGAEAREGEEVVDAADAHGVDEGEEQLPDHEVACPVGRHREGHRETSDALGGELRHEQRGDRAAPHGEAEDVQDRAKQHDRGADRLKRRDGEREPHQQHADPLPREAAAEEGLAAEALDDAGGRDGPEQVHEPRHRVGQRDRLDAGLLEHGAREEEDRVHAAELLEEEHHEGDGGHEEVPALEQLRERHGLLLVLLLS
mmetsp:Transcript_16409/g.38946  ORF Transcript_16409/g.38946 Transcript_16409/m.38946 type:complete len:234 (+) Transcript_16409:335-1036(+)